MDRIFMLWTTSHITQVTINLVLFSGYEAITRQQLLSIAKQHDASKFSEPERIAYTLIAWRYHLKNQGKLFEYDNHLKQTVITGWQHHIKHNSHHPEYHKNPNQMSLLNLIEMVCDWVAISEGNSQAWATENMPKWHFSYAVQKKIVSLIDFLLQKKSPFADD